MSSLVPSLQRAAALGLGLPFLYSLLEPHRVLLRRYEVRLPHLPAAVDGLRIVQISDLHVSALTSPRFLRRVVQTCNNEKPDLVALTGDFVSRRNSYSHFTFARMWAKPVMHYAEAMAAELKRLQAPDGVFGVPGNHDHSRGHFEAIEKLLHGAGVQTPVNQSTCVRGVLPVVGLDDLRAGRPRVRQAFAGIDAQSAQLVLSHNPRILPLLKGRNCLVLAGHTHAGQVHLPLTNFRRRPRDMRGGTYFQGWYQEGQARMYVNSGIGSVHFPMRFRCPPEIAVFTLRNGD